MADFTVAGMDQQTYARQMQDYAQKTYDRSFEIVEWSFSREGFNTGRNKQHTVLRDREMGFLVNVYAHQDNPMDFYDDYVSAYAAYLLRDTVDLSAVADLGNYSLSVSLEEEDASAPNTAPENVSIIRLVVNIHAAPEEAHLEQLYRVYSDLAQAGYESVFFYVGFTKPDETFQKYTQNFAWYGSKYWQDLDGTVYASLLIRSNELTYSQFKEKLETH